MLLDDEDVRTYGNYVPEKGGHAVSDPTDHMLGHRRQHHREHQLQLVGSQLGVKFTYGGGGDV